MGNTDSTMNYRKKDLARWLRTQLRKRVENGGWNSEVYDCTQSRPVGGAPPVLTVIFSDNKRLKVTVEIVE